MSRHWVVLIEEDVGASTSAGTSLVEVAGIGVSCKDHISCKLGDDVVWVYGNVVEELVYSVSSGLSGHSLLVVDGAKSEEKFIVDRAPVPQEGSNNTLDAFDDGGAKWRARGGRSRLLGIGSVEDRGMLVRG